MISVMREIKLLGLLLAISILAGCASTGGSSPSSVGMKRVSPEVKVAMQRSPLSVVVPVFDPNIPTDQDKIVEQSIWPEVRRTEATRMALSLGDALNKSQFFNGVRITPDTESNSEIYVMGKIVESNGEDVEISINVVTLAAKKLLKKNYDFRVQEYSLEDPRLGSTGDLYEPVYTEIANDVVKAVRKLKQKQIDELEQLELLSFAEFFEPRFAQQYLAEDRKGNRKVVGFPASTDPMVRRIESMKMMDQMFFDNLQTDYRGFYDDSVNPYAAWQRAAFVESKAAREARAAANTKAILGAVALIAGAAAMNNSGYNDYGSLYGGAAVAVGGAAAIAAAMGDSKQAEAHKESLSELGKSLNLEMAPKVIALEETQVELKGTASEQYETWMSAMKTLYDSEEVPDVNL
jgi:hypothetical protein